MAPTSSRAPPTKLSTTTRIGMASTAMAADCGLSSTGMPVAFNTPSTHSTTPLSRPYNAALMTGSRKPPSTGIAAKYRPG